MRSGTRPRVRSSQTAHRNMWWQARRLVRCAAALASFALVTAAALWLCAVAMRRRFQPLCAGRTWPEQEVLLVPARTQSALELGCLQINVRSPD